MSFFLRSFLAFAVPAMLAASAGSASAPRHYDCSKAGNANKTACKAAATAAPAAKPTRTTTTQRTTTTTRHYDCAKRGNANKAVCRTAANETPTGRTSGAETRTTKTTAITIDCSKWYNKRRATCRTSASASPVHTSVAPAPRPSASPSRRTRETVGTGESVNDNPNGAVAQCKDGRYSHAAHRSGACSRHGGVAKWLQG